MTLHVNFNLVSGKTITLRMEEPALDNAIERINSPGFYVHNEDGSVTVVFAANVESITARKV